MRGFSGNSIGIITESVLKDFKLGNKNSKNSSLITKVNSPICNSNLGQSVNSSTKSLISLLIMSFSTLSFVVIVVGFMLVVVVEVSES